MNGILFFSTLCIQLIDRIGLARHIILMGLHVAESSPWGGLLFDGIRGCAAQMACFISLSSVTMGAF